MPRNGACSNYVWNPVSAAVKGVSVVKGGGYNSSIDAFRIASIVVNIIITIENQNLLIFIICSYSKGKIFYIFV